LDTRCRYRVTVPPPAQNTLDLIRIAERCTAGLVAVHRKDAQPHYSTRRWPLRRVHDNGGIERDLLLRHNPWEAVLQ
ncbi:MAG: hypothetical protein ABII12_14690, partial [Planctomycetota bacterium]